MLRDRKDGYILITTMIALAVLAVLGTAALGWALTGLRLSRQAVESEQAFYMANAGIEESLAKLLASQTLSNFSRSMTVAPGLTGTYSVTFATQPDESVAVTSTGRVGSSVRLVTARMVPGTSGGGGSGGTGGTGGTVTPPPGVPAQVYQQVIYSNGSLAFNNNSVICGDLYSVGSVILDNNSRVIGTAGSPCSAVTGTGKLVATGVVSIGNNSSVAGGWCDSTHWGAPYPCATKPNFAAVVPPDLSSQATITNTGSLTASGTRTYSNDIVRVTGDLTVDSAGLAISGNVTFAVAGRAYINGNLTCSGSCTVAIVAQGDIITRNNVSIRSTLVTAGRLTLGNQVTIYGNLQAGSFDVLNGAVLYPLPASTQPATPPSLTGWNS